MTREEFIEILDREGYSYEIEGDKIVVTDDNVDISFGSGLTTLPSGVEFRNGGFLDAMNALIELPPDVKFSNDGGVALSSLKRISPGVVFRNEGDVELHSLVGGWFDRWPGNIEGIDNKSLLNVMVKRGMFI